MNLQGHAALITGSTKGVGRSIAEAFAAAGCHVVVHGRSLGPDVEQVLANCRRHGVEAHFVSGDLSGHTEQAVETVFSGAVAALPKLDILVNNAGVAWGAPLDSFPEVGWDKVMDTNVKGVFFLTQKLLPLLRAAAGGASPARVVNIGSVDGLKTAVFDNFSYGASKAAVHHLTRFMAAHLTKERILFNAIAPGPFPTWMLSTGVGFAGETENVDWERVGRGNPSGRVGTAQDIAGLTIFLCSRAGEYVIGQTIACDGGEVASS